MFYAKLIGLTIGGGILLLIDFLIHGQLDKSLVIFIPVLMVVIFITSELVEINENLHKTNKELDRVIDQLREIAKNTYKTANKD